MIEIQLPPKVRIREVRLDVDDFYDEEYPPLAVLPTTVEELEQLERTSGIKAVELYWRAGADTYINAGEVQLEGVRTVHMNKLYQQTDGDEYIIDLRTFKPAEWLSGQKRGFAKQVWEDELRAGYEYCMREILACIEDGADAVRVCGDRVLEDYNNVGMSYRDGPHNGHLGIIFYPDRTHYYTYDTLAHVVLKHKRG